MTPVSAALEGDVPPDGRSDPYAVVERVIQLLDEGSFVSTYKHAVLLGLIDVCTRQGLRAMPTSMVTTRQLAEAVIELYWPQTRHWADRQLRDGTALRRQGCERQPRRTAFRRPDRRRVRSLSRTPQMVVVWYDRSPACSVGAFGVAQRERVRGDERREHVDLQLGPGESRAEHGRREELIAVAEARDLAARRVRKGRRRA